MCVHLLCPYFLSLCDQGQRSIFDVPWSLIAYLKHRFSCSCLIWTYIRKRLRQNWQNVSLDQLMFEGKLALSNQQRVQLGNFRERLFEMHSQLIRLLNGSSMYFTVFVHGTSLLEIVTCPLEDNFSFSFYDQQCS